MRQTADILFIAPFNHDHGTERITSHVIKAATQTYSSIALLYSGGLGNMFRDAVSRLDMVFNIGVQDRRANIYRNAFQIMVKVCVLRPRILFTVNPVMGMSVGLALKLLPDSLRPFSILVHHVDPRQRDDMAETRRMMQWFQMFDRHIVVSSSMMGGLKPYLGGNTNTVECIPNGIDIDEIQNTVRSSTLGIMLVEHRWRCVCVGGLRPDRRVDRLIHAFALLPERDQTVLLLVGDGEIKTQLMTLANVLGVAERCFFAGHQALPFEWFRDCQLFVQTPDWETFGLSVLEAMAAGLPVLTMGDNSPGLQEFVHDGINGRVVASGDINEFAQAWSELLRNPAQRKAIASAGLETAKQYSLDVMSDRYMQLLSSCG